MPTVGAGKSSEQSWQYFADHHSECLAYLRLLRITDAFVAALGVFIGVHLAGLTDVSIMSLVTMIAVIVCLSFASMAINDWFDVPVDSINKPGRPIPAGAISRDGAIRVAVALFLLALILAVSLSTATAGMAVAISIGSVLYSARLKRTPFLGHLVVSVIAASPLWCWLTLGGIPEAAFLVLIGSLVLLNLGREIARAVEDRRGDEANGIVTLASKIGTDNTARLSCLFQSAALLLAWYPAIASYSTWQYRTSVAVCSVMILAALFNMHGIKGEESSRRWATNGRVCTGILAVGISLGLMPIN